MQIDQLHLSHLAAEYRKVPTCVKECLTRWERDTIDEELLWTLERNIRQK